MWDCEEGGNDDDRMRTKEALSFDKIGHLLSWLLGNEGGPGWMPLFSVLLPVYPIKGCVGQIQTLYYHLPHPLIAVYSKSQGELKGITIHLLVISDPSPVSICSNAIYVLVLARFDIAPNSLWCSRDCALCCINGFIRRVRSTRNGAMRPCWPFHYPTVLCSLGENNTTTACHPHIPFRSWAT